MVATSFPYRFRHHGDISLRTMRRALCAPFEAQITSYFQLDPRGVSPNAGCGCVIEGLVLAGCFRGAARKSRSCSDTAWATVDTEVLHPHCIRTHYRPALIRDRALSPTGAGRPQLRMLTARETTTATVTNEARG